MNFLQFRRPRRSPEMAVSHLKDSMESKPVDNYKNRQIVFASFGTG